MLEHHVPHSTTAGRPLQLLHGKVVLHMLDEILLYLRRHFDIRRRWLLLLLGLLMVASHPLLLILVVGTDGLRVLLLLLLQWGSCPLKKASIKTLVSFVAQPRPNRYWDFLNKLELPMNEILLTFIAARRKADL